MRKRSVNYNFRVLLPDQVSLTPKRRWHRNYCCRHSHIHLPTSIGLDGTFLISNKAYKTINEAVRSEAIGLTSVPCTFETCCIPLKKGPKCLFPSQRIFDWVLFSRWTLWSNHYVQSLAKVCCVISLSISPVSTCFKEMQNSKRYYQLIINILVYLTAATFTSKIRAT